MTLFKKLQAKLKPSTTAIKLEAGEESFVFHTEEDSDEQSERKPKWAEDMLNDLIQIRERVQSSEEVFATQNVNGNKSKQNYSRNNDSQGIKCYACNQYGHIARNCRSHCSSCNGTGHNYSVCPSRSSKKFLSKRKKDQA